MNLAWAVLIFVLSTMALAMVGCTSNKPFRTSFAPFDPNGPDHTKAVVETWPDFKLGFVEFDDQGWFWCDKQRVAVEQMIRDESGTPVRTSDAATTRPSTQTSAPAEAAATAPATTAPTTTAKGIILVAFVHGWKDNAAYDDGGLRAFRRILKQLNTGEQARAKADSQNTTARKVVGVYLGWRGLSATWEPFKELSIFERKDTAHKVGGYGAMTQLFTELEDIQKDNLDLLPQGAPRTELIIIGHSLGAGAVYSALSQIITDRFVNSVALPGERQKRLKPLGDQIILLNPAFEAVRHYNLNQMALAIDTYPQDQRPVLSIFTSQGDWATHYVFPLYRFFSTFFDSNRSKMQRSANYETVGWFKPFVTHELIYKPDSLAPATQSATASSNTGADEPSESKKMRASYLNIKTQRGHWKPGHHPPVTYTFDDTILQPVDDFHPGDPFLVVSVDKQIMNDHTDIANPELINFIGNYVQFCLAEPKDRTK